MARTSKAFEWPDRLVNLLPRLPLFAGVARKDLKALLDDFDWFSLPGGWPLLERGDTGDALYVVTAGSLGTLTTDPSGRESVTGQIQPGHAVGELSLLTGEPRTNTLVALRDTEVLRLPREVFEKVASRHPVVLNNLAALMVRRIAEIEGTRHTTERSDRPRALALVPLGRDLPMAEIAAQLSLALSTLGGRTFVIDASRAQESTDWFHEIEAAHDTVLYLGADANDTWTQLCLRQADRVMLLARPHEPGSEPHPVQALLETGSKRFLEMLFLHPGDAPCGTGTGPLVEAFAPDFFHNIREGHHGDLGRVARSLSGRAAGLVLGGGGARGFAHLGVLRALQETGIEFDMVGGTSMGAIIAAGLALEWDLDELQTRMKQSFVAQNPLSDVTVPLTALVRGRKVMRLLQDHFEDNRIEETWRHFFCVSANLTTGAETVHRTGPIWQALRASVAIPGVLPPVVDKGEILVDGAVMNNFPADFMADLKRGPLIGVDVEGDHAVEAMVEQWREEADWGVLGDQIRGGPGIVTILMRAGTVNSQAQTRHSRARVDLLFRPPIEDVGIRDWKFFNKAMDAGYAHAMGVLSKADLSVLAR